MKKKDWEEKQVELKTLALSNELYTFKPLNSDTKSC